MRLQTIQSAVSLAFAEAVVLLPNIRAQNKRNIDMTMLTGPHGSNRFKTGFSVIVLSAMLAACSSSGSSNPGNVNIAEGTTAGDTTAGGNNLTGGNTTTGGNNLTGGNNTTGGTSTIDTLINVDRADGWVCLLAGARYGAYSFFSNSTGKFESLTQQSDGTFSIDTRVPFSYSYTSDTSVQALYEFSDGSSLQESVTNISFADENTMTALSDLEGTMECTRNVFLVDSEAPQDVVEDMNMQDFSYSP